MIMITELFLKVLNKKIFEFNKMEFVMVQNCSLFMGEDV
jgi:hypothetical protein